MPADVTMFSRMLSSVRKFCPSDLHMRGDSSSLTFRVCCSYMDTRASHADVILVLRPNIFSAPIPTHFLGAILSALRFATVALAVGGVPSFLVLPTCHSHPMGGTSTWANVEAVCEVVGASSLAAIAIRGSLAIGLRARPTSCLLLWHGTKLGCPRSIFEPISIRTNLNVPNPSLDEKRSRDEPLRHSGCGLPCRQP